MSDVSEIKHILDPNFDKRCLALVCFVHTYGFNPERLFQVDLNPKQLSRSRRFIRITGSQYSDVHGWFPVNSIEVVEILSWCDEKGEPLQSPYATAEVAKVSNG